MQGWVAPVDWMPRCVMSVDWVQHFVVSVDWMQCCGVSVMCCVGQGTVDMQWVVPVEVVSYVVLGVMCCVVFVCYYMLHYIGQSVDMVSFVTVTGKVDFEIVTVTAIVVVIVVVGV